MIRLKLRALLPLALLTCAVSLTSAGAESAPDPHPARGMMVAFKNDAPLSARLRVLQRFGLEQDSGFRSRFLTRVRARARAGSSVLARAAALAAALKADPAVRIAEPDYLVRADAVPNDTHFSHLWGLHNQGQTGGTAGVDIDAPEAWDTTTGSGKVIVAVIDSGVDYNHPDLKNNILRDASGALVGYDYCNKDPDPMDDHGHGTHCAGTIGAVGGNGIGVAGVCPNVKIMPLKFMAADGSGYTSDAIQCIEFAIARGAHIMNNSWGGGGRSQLLLEAIQRARNAGILFVAAAGNESANNDQVQSYPANYNSESANVLSVAATDHNDALGSFSNYGATRVDIAAPGVQILSTVPGGYAFSSGTSMAAPHVAGAAALLRSRYPTESLAELKKRLLETVERPQSLAGKVVSGRLSLNRALTAAAALYSISGYVAQGGALLPGTTVTCGGQTVTSANGVYRFEGLKAGTYTVTAVKTGYRMTGPYTVTVGPSQENWNFGATALAGDPATYAISGYVVQGGALLPGVTITCGDRTFSSSDGAYRIEGLPRGVYTVTASKAGYRMSGPYTVTVGPSQVNWNFAATATVDETATYSISGYVAQGGALLPGTTVTCGGQTVTSANGVYRFEGLKAGTYTVTAVKTGYRMTGPYTVTVGPSQENWNFGASATSPAPASVEAG